MQEAQEGATLWCVKCFTPSVSLFYPKTKEIYSDFFPLHDLLLSTRSSALLVGGNVMKVLPLLALTCPLLLPFPTVAKMHHKKYMKRDPDTRGYAEMNINNQK